MTEIPVWRKAVLSVEEAAAYGNLAAQLIRAYVGLARIGHSDFPVFMSGDTIKIPRVAFENWLTELGNKHTRLDFNEAKRLAEESQVVGKRGRKRKIRA